MLSEKDTIKCESIFNDERTHRFLWKQVWNKDKPLMAVIMLNPCQADNIITDTTTSLVINNVARLEEYGGVEIVNLYSLLTPKLHFRWNADEELNDAENDKYIIKAAEECETVVLGWGKSVDNNQRIAERVEKVIDNLSIHKEKLMYLTDGERVGLHPLTPTLRTMWNLVPYTDNNENTLPENNDSVLAD